MSEIELCRLCTNVTHQTNAEKLFERNQLKLLRQIEDLIGQRLKNEKYLPQHICKPCEERTLQAHEFRAQCIRAQKHFALQKKETKDQQGKLEEIAPTIEEVVLNASNPVKEENEEKEDNAYQLPPHHITEEILFKHEPTNSDDGFNVGDSHDSFNPLDEDCRNTTEDDEEDVMTREPEISLFAGEKPLFNNKLKQHKKQKSTIKTKKITVKQNSSIKEKNFICDQCGRNFLCISMLDTHMKRHTGERQFKCEICPESFFLNSDLKRHILKHAGILPYPCSHCDRRFLDKSHAKKHERTHTNERPFVCQQCGKGFTVSHILHDHMVTHTGERAFSCKMCNVAFKRKTHLKTHYRSMTHKQNEEKYQMNVNIPTQ